MTSTKASLKGDSKTEIPPFYYMDSIGLSGFTYRFFTLLHKSTAHLLETIWWILDFALFLSWWSRVQYSCDDGQLPKPHNHEGQQLNHLQPFYFSLPVQNSIHYIWYSTLDGKIGFVVVNFVWLEATIDVLSTFRQAGLSCDFCMLGVLGAFFN